MSSWTTVDNVKMEDRNKANTNRSTLSGLSPHLTKDHHTMTMKFMSILAERDDPIQERNLAISEKKAALAERDMAIMHRDTAITERNNALMERDNAIAALEYRESTTVNGSTGNPRAMKHMHHP